MHGIFEINESKEVVRLPVKKHLSMDKIRTKEIIDANSPESLAAMKRLEDFLRDFPEMHQLSRGKLRTTAGSMAKSCFAYKPM